MRPLILGILATLAGTGLMAAGATGWNVKLTNNTHPGTGTFFNVTELSVDELDAVDDTTDALTAGSGSFAMPWTGFSGDKYLVDHAGSADTFSFQPTPHGALGYDGVSDFVKGFPVTLDAVVITAENGLFATITAHVSGTAPKTD